MKRYTIEINKKNTNNNFSFRTNTNPSKKLDDLILSNLIKMNPFLGYKKSDDILDAMFDDAGFNTDRIIIPNRDYSYLLKGNFNSEFAKAANFLSSYTPSKKSYTLSDGTPIAFFEDEIQIGYDLIPLYKLSSSKYYATFTPEIKNTIINIFISINR
jgi:hypothetical protein